MDFKPENLCIVITSLVVLFWACFYVFFACECGTIVCTQFARFDYELWQCTWYQFPIEMQRILVLVMSNIQNPATIYSYGNFECTRDSFKRVIQTANYFFVVSPPFVMRSLLNAVVVIIFCIYTDNSSWIFVFHDD